MMTDPELPLPEFATLEKVPLPPKPRYRCKVRFKVEYDDYVNFQTDGDPNEWLEDDGNVEGPLDDIIAWGSGDYWSYPEYGPVEVSYDDGVSWEVFKHDR